MSDNVRKPSLTDTALQEKLRVIACDNTLDCEQVQQFAEENGLALDSMRTLVQSAGIIIRGCRGACS